MSVLARLLMRDRHRNPSGNGLVQKIPFLLEEEVKFDTGVVLVTNSKSDWVFTKKTKEGLVRCGICKAPVENESLLISNLGKALVGSPRVGSFTSLGLAVHKMLSLGIKPKKVVIDYAMVSKFLTKPLDHKELDTLMKIEGRIGQVGDLDVLVTPSLEGVTGILFSEPEKLGTYTRIGDSLGVAIYNVETNVALVK